MSSAPDVVRFNGTKWEECHNFITAIRARALWEGKQRDPAWMADLATPLFWGKALSWHCRLPQDVRQDWFKLEIALVDRWSPSEDDEEPEVRPTPAAAPSMNLNEKSNLPLQGVLKLVLHGSNKDYYVALRSALCVATTDMRQALRVRCDSLPNATLLERMNHSCHSWLAAQWAYSVHKIGEGSTQFGRMICFNLVTPKPTCSSSPEFQLLTWTLLPTGEANPVWRKDDGSKVTLVSFVRDAALYLAADPEAYAEENQKEIRAKLFIEPID